MAMSTNKRSWSTFFDPLDIAGTRAKDTQDEMQDIIEASAREALASAKGRYAKVEALQRPFVQYGEEALQDTELKPFSQQYFRDLREGGRSINKGLAAKGMSESSFAGENLIDFGLDMANREIATQHQNRLQKMRIGQYASGMTGQAGQQLGSSAVNLAGGHAAGVEEGYNAFGAQRRASLQSAGNAMQSFGSYMDNM